MRFEVSRFIAKNAALGGLSLSAREVTALNYLVTELKNNGLWPTSGAAGIYPFVGSTAIQHSLNLFNPDANRLTWVNDSAAYHTSTGYTANYDGRAYANTGIKPGGYGRQQSYTIYARTLRTGNSNAPDIAASTDGNRRLYICINNDNAATNHAYIQAMSAFEGVYGTVTGSRAGCYSFNVNNGTNSIYKGGALVASGTVGTTAVAPTQDTCIGTEPTNVAGGANSTGNEYAYVDDTGLIPTSLQAIKHQIIQQFQTILGRNI